MENEDTIDLLRECSAGVKMGIATIEYLLPHVHDEKFQDALRSSKTTHEELYGEISNYLQKYEVPKKEPPIMAKSMAWIKTNMQIRMNDSDKTIANLITDGCNTGIKSLTSYLNKYKNAKEEIREISRKLINSEEKLVERLKDYL
ncbi:MAG: hypothetical protein ACI4PJ_01355 [Acutalibacteraceae bacterium]